MYLNPARTAHTFREHYNKLELGTVRGVLAKNREETKQVKRGHSFCSCQVLLRSHLRHIHITQAPLDSGTHPYLLHALPEPCLAIAESSPSNVSLALNSFESENAGKQQAATTTIWGEAKVKSSNTQQQQQRNKFDVAKQQKKLARCDSQFKLNARYHYSYA